MMGIFAIALEYEHFVARQRQRVDWLHNAGFHPDLEFDVIMKEAENECHTTIYSFRHILEAKVDRLFRIANDSISCSVEEYINSKRSYE